MSIIRSIRSFNPLLPQEAVDQSVIRNVVQNIVDYAESRFHAILTDTRDKAIKNTEYGNWVQTLLHRELVRLSPTSLIIPTF